MLSPLNSEVWNLTLWISKAPSWVSSLLVFLCSFCHILIHVWLCSSHSSESQDARIAPSLRWMKIMSVLLIAPLLILQGKLHLSNTRTPALVSISQILMFAFVFGLCKRRLNMCVFVFGLWKKRLNTNARITLTKLLFSWVVTRIVFFSFWCS